MMKKHPLVLPVPAAAAFWPAAAAFWQASAALLLAAATLWLAAAAPAFAANPLVEPFVGQYVGRSISSADGGLSERDLGVSIQAKKNGFTVQWTTVTKRPDGSVKRKDYAIDFAPSRRGNLFSSAMRANKFGARVPLDPMKGDPYVWAKIEGRTMTIYAMLITDDGGYEMQVYRRVLTDTGMNLEFSRFRDGRQFKLVKATLSKVRE